MNLVIFGLSITSTWGNGHGNTYRSLCRALAERGHKVTFFEKDELWYRENRDLPKPEYCTLVLYRNWRAIASRANSEMRAADAVIVGSYVAEGHTLLDTLLPLSRPVKAFYDIDTPITVAALLGGKAVPYLRAEQVPGLDLYLSFTGGPMLSAIESALGARRAAPLYCSFDPRQYFPRPAGRRYACDLSYMGTYAPDRQAKLDELLCRPAERLPNASFLVAGPQYPKGLKWPKNVRRISHLNPRWHAHFYASSRITLNVTRREMVRAGYSPSVRLFEAAACGAVIASDNWPGLETFFTPGEEILLPADGGDMVRLMRDAGEDDLRRIGARAAERARAEHTNAARARELEALLEGAFLERTSNRVARAV